MFKYWGLDWINLILVPLNIWLLGNRKKSGFVVGMISCVCSFSWSYMAGSVANVILACVILVLHARGWLKWTLIEREKERERSYANLLNEPD